VTGLHCGQSDRRDPALVLRLCSRSP